MAIFYFLSLIPIAAAVVLWFFNKRIIWWESLSCAALALILAGIFNIYSYNSQLGDEETWSGEYVKAERIPAWLESYEEAIYRTEYYTDTETRYRTVGTGSKARTESYTVRVTKSRRVFDHWEPRTRWHSEECSARTNLSGYFDQSINRSFYDYLHRNFGKEVAVNKSHSTMEHNSRQIGGDYHDYSLQNVNDFIEPVAEMRTWDNKLKMDNTVYAFAKVPEGIAMPNYPLGTLNSRLIGDNKYNFATNELDKVNSRLGQYKHCNLIIVGFPSGQPIANSEYLKSAWRGGKQNDLIIVFAGDSAHPEWAQVISWSDSEAAKIEIRNLVFKNGITKDSLYQIKNIILTKWEKKNWREFDYISVRPKEEHVGWFFGILALTESALLVFFYFNGQNRGQNIFSNNE